MSDLLSLQQSSFLETLERNLGVVELTLEQTGVSRSEYTLWLENIFFKERVKDVEQRQLDFVENELLKQIKEGNIGAITFYLKTKGKKRGY